MVDTPLGALPTGPLSAMTDARLDALSFIGVLLSSLSRVTTSPRRSFPSRRRSHWARLCVLGLLLRAGYVKKREEKVVHIFQPRSSAFYFALGITSTHRITHSFFIPICIITACDGTFAVCAVQPHATGYQPSGPVSGSGISSAYMGNILTAFDVTNVRWNSSNTATQPISTLSLCTDASRSAFMPASALSRAL